MPVTARGAATGLSGGCIPVPGGLVVSLARMKRLLEIDTANHVAIVQPGLTLAELDEATAAHGLVFPVFPGTNAASLGGNVATNAGGMRAVKYGVTRNQVLGIEAVTGTGEVIRSGGRYVKATTGYDLTQLVVGSEGTLALVTEATLRLAPATDRHGLAAGALRLGGRRGRRGAAYCGLGCPAPHPRVHRPGHHERPAAHERSQSRRTRRGSRPTEAYLIVVLEGRDDQRLQVDVADVAEQLADGARGRCYVLPAGQGAELLAAGERAFWLVKAAGADDLIDMVVPRDKIPDYLAQVHTIADRHESRVFGCGHAGDGNIHFSVYQPDQGRRSALLRAIFEAGLALGGAISGEHGIGRAKKGYYQALEDPAKLALQRRIKEAFDPLGILNPGCVFDLV